jgi:hypothetical protein
VKVGEKVDAVVLRKGKKVELKGIEIPEARQVNPMPPQLRLQPQPLPNLNLPPRPNIKQVPRVNAPRPINPNAGVDGRAFNSVSVSQSNGEFTIKAVQNGVNYVVTGTSGDGMPVVDKVTITDGDKKPVEAASVKDVPENYRATVEKLVQSLGRRR